VLAGADDPDGVLFHYGYVVPSGLLEWFVDIAM
jgi:hypothetical protein